MKIKQKHLAIIALTFFFFGLKGQTAEAATIRVSGNNSAAIQSALDSAASGDTVVIPAGDYYLTTQVSQKNKNLSLIGEGTVNLYLQAPAARSSDIHFMGSFITNKSLGASAEEGNSQLVLSDASQVRAGDLIKVWKSVQWCPLDYPDQPTGEMYLVKSVNGNTVTLNQPLLRDYDLAQSPKADIYRPVEIHVSNIRFHDGGATTMHESLGILYGINSSVTNCWFSDNGMSAVSFYSSFNVRAENNEVYNCILPGSGYGIGIWDATAFVYVINNYVENCRHAVTGNESERKGLIRDVIISNNTFKGANIGGSNVIDAHNVVINYTVTKNKVYPGTSFYAFTDGSEQSIFSDNEVYGGYGAVIRRGSVNGGIHIIKNNYTEGNSMSFTYRGYGTDTGGVSDTLIIANNRQVGGRYGISFSDQMPEAFKNMVISGNNFNNIANVGISIKFYTDGTNLEIYNNTFENIARGGIYLETNGHTNGDLKILNNTVKNVNTSGGDNSGVAFYGFKNSSICSNTISDSTSRTKYGVYEGTGSSNSSIFGNTITGMSVGEIHWNSNPGSSSGVCPAPAEIITPDILWSYGEPEGFDGSVSGIGSSSQGDSTPSAPAIIYSTSFVSFLPSSFSPSFFSPSEEVIGEAGVLTIINGSGSGVYDLNEVVGIAANPPSSSLYVFRGWYGATEYIDDPTSSTTTITMPDESITIAALYGNVPHSVTLHNFIGVDSLIEVVSDILIDNSSWACPEVTLQGRVWGNLVPPGVARLVYDDILMICQNIL